MDSKVWEDGNTIHWRGKDYKLLSFEGGRRSGIVDMVSGRGLSDSQTWDVSLRRNVWADDTDLEVMDLFVEFNHKTEYEHQEEEGNFFFSKEDQNLSSDTWKEEWVKVKEKEKSGEKNIVFFKPGEERLLGMLKCCQEIK